MAETVKHIVIIKFKDEITDEQKQRLMDEILRLPALSPQIKAVEWGTELSVLNYHEGFTHAFVMTFDSTEEYKAYLAHPAHKEIEAKYMPTDIDKIVVFDFKPSKVACS